MAVSRRKKARRGRPRTLGPSQAKTVKSVAPSLPPVPLDETPQPAATLPAKWTERPPEGHPDRCWWLPDDSIVRPTAMAIIARRMMGEDDANIAKALGISEKSVSPYVYRATKNGWLDIGYNPKERVQFQMMHKVVEMLEDGLNDKTRQNTGMKVQTAVALKVFENTLAKQFDQQQQQAAPTTVVAVQVVMPEGPRQSIRAETTGGTPAYIDAEPV